MKQMPRLFLLIILSLTTLLVFGQVDCDTTRYSKLLNNSYQRKWTFFTLKDTIDGVVIKHEKQTTACGVIATASLTIIKTSNGTIRVLDMCNLGDNSVGQRIKIIPKIEPNFQVHIPSYILISGSSKKKMTKKEKDKQKKITEKELPVWRSNEYDERILKTTWGQLINE